MEHARIVPGLAQKLIKNTFFNVLGKVWSLLVAFALTPYIIHRVGVERFGIWAIASVITGYFGLFDFGIGTSFVKYISEFYTKKDHLKLNQVINTGMFFYFLFSLFTIAISFFAVGPMLAFLKIPAHLYAEALFVFWLGIILFCVYNIMSTFEAIPTGLQRMDISNKVAMLVSLPNIAGTVFFLENGYGLRGLMVNNAIILAISGAINVVISYRIFPQLRFNLFLSTRETFNELFSFGFKVQLTRAAIIINNSIVKLLTGHFLNLTLVGFYELGQKIIMFARDILLMSVSAILPAAAETEAKNNRAMTQELYLKVSKYFNILAMPAMAFIFVAAPLIILGWTGSEYKTSVLVVWLLMPGQVINILTAVGGYMAQGIGRPGITARALTITAILNLIISTILVFKAGFIGAVIGTSFSLGIGSLIFINIFNRYLKIPVLPFLKSTLSIPLAASLMAAAVVYCTVHFYGSFYHSRPVNILLLVLNGCLFTCIYTAVILKSNHLDANDRNNIIKIFNFLILRGKK